MDKNSLKTAYKRSKVIRQLFRCDKVKEECKYGFVTFLKIMSELHILNTKYGPLIFGPCFVVGPHISDNKCLLIFRFIIPPYANK